MLSRRPIALAIVAAVLFGISAPLAKGVLNGATPQAVAGLLYLGSGLGLGILWVLRRRQRATIESPLTRKDIPWLAGAIVAGGVVGPVLLLSGLARTPASAASLLLNFEGVFTASIAWIAFRENVDRRIALGMLAIIAGGALLSWEGQADWGGAIGPLLIAGACFAWGVDNNLSQKISGGDPMETAALKGLVAGTVNAALAFSLGAHWPRPAYVVGALVLGFVSYGLSLVLYLKAMRDLGIARTGAYFSFAPFVGATLGLVLWRESVTLAFVGAAVLMGLGLWLHVTERHEHRHVHEPLAHSHAHRHDAHHAHTHAPGDPPGEPHTHWHEHEPLVHSHPHYPDLHHRHGHG